MSIYALHDPRDGRCRYVGMSRRPEIRLRDHLKGIDSSVKFRKWLRQLRAANIKPLMKVLSGGTEAGWIRRLQPDLNIHPGNRDRRHPSARNAIVSIEFPDKEWAKICDLAFVDHTDPSTWVRRATMVVAAQKKI